MLHPLTSYQQTLHPQILEFGVNVHTMINGDKLILRRSDDTSRWEIGG
jgi:hypothetical protein